LRACCEHTWEHLDNQTRSVPSSAIRSVHEIMLGSAIESVLRAYWGAYSPAGCEFAIECNWECTGKRAQKCDCEHLESLLECVSQAGWECTVKCNQVYNAA
jgi:hypothetical protein